MSQQQHRWVAPLVVDKLLSHFLRTSPRYPARLVLARNIVAQEFEFGVVSHFAQRQSLTATCRRTPPHAHQIKSTGSKKQRLQLLCRSAPRTFVWYEWFVCVVHVLLSAYLRDHAFNGLRWYTQACSTSGLMNRAHVTFCCVLEGCHVHVSNDYTIMRDAACTRMRC